MPKDIYPGLKIDRLTVVEETNRTASKDRQWVVSCVCGSTVVMSSSNLRRSVKTEKSCGCVKVKHGKWKSSSYETWSGMMKRCYKSSAVNYDRYGGRGIVVCDRWHDFSVFLNDMGERPSGMSIDRIDNDGEYCKENCRWATVKEQARNRRSNINVTLEGKTQCVKGWAEDIGIRPDLIYRRIRRGWSAIRAVTSPSYRLP